MKDNKFRWKHSFNMEAIGMPVVNIEVSEEQTLPEIIEAFEKFLLAVGYVLPDGSRLGYEWDEDEPKRAY